MQLFITKVKTSEDILERKQPKIYMYGEAIRMCKI